MYAIREQAMECVKLSSMQIAFTNHNDVLVVTIHDIVGPSRSGGPMHRMRGKHMLEAIE